MSVRCETTNLNNGGPCMRFLRKLALSTVLLALLTSPASAQWGQTPRSGSNYDWRNGNMYNWNQTPDGSTNVRGFNTNTGSQWNTTIKPNGDMQGMDSKGNLWQYNQNSGSYLNSNGTVCVGKGAA